MTHKLYIKPVEMSESEIRACRKGLEKLKQILDSNDGFNRLHKKGVYEINVWSPLSLSADKDRYPSLWAMAILWIKSKFWQYNLDPKIYRKDMHFKALVMLSNALHNPETFEILVLLGTRGFIMPDADDYKNDGYHGFVGVRNHRGCLDPNWDYSFREDGSLWFHS